MNSSRNDRAAARPAATPVPSVTDSAYVPFSPPPVPSPDARITELAAFGSNPGKLRMLFYGPTARRGGPVVVLLHGCGQDAVSFARDTGWAALAYRLGITLVLPEQAEENNSGRCFHWFRPGDTARGRGEAASIAAMTNAAIHQAGAAPERVFVAGLSAGGAMAAALLAAYPDLFSAGAVVAGLPVGAAVNSFQALLRMSHPGPAADAATLAALVARSAPAGFAGPWPRLSIWHGTADSVVVPDNAAQLAAQWRALHQAPLTPLSDNQVRGAHYTAWGWGGRIVVERWFLHGRDHGYPVASAGGPPGHWVLPEAVPATERIARFWGLT